MFETCLYVYGIVPAGRLEVDGVQGLDDVPAEGIAVDGLEAVVTRHPPATRFDATEEALVRHDAVCTAVMRLVPVAPARFGTAFRDEESLRAELANRAGELKRILERLEGRVELGLRVFTSATVERPEGAESSGTAFLEKRLAERQTAVGLATAVDDRLARLAVARTSSVLETPGVPLSASYLVGRESVEEFRAAVAALDGEHAHVTLICTGPWPPYSFVDGAE